MQWEMYEAKRNFEAVVEHALWEGPQALTRGGTIVAFVVSGEEYRKLSNGTPDFKEFLLSGPDLSPLDMER